MLYDPVSPAYFSTIGVPLLAGREFNSGDVSARSKVAIVNESLAKRFFPKRDPMGSHLAFGSGNVKTGHLDRRSRKGQQAGSRSQRNGSLHFPSVCAAGKTERHDLLCAHAARPPAHRRRVA